MLPVVGDSRLTNFFKNKVVGEKSTKTIFGMLLIHLLNLLYSYHWKLPTECLDAALHHFNLVDFYFSISVSHSHAIYV